MRPRNIVGKSVFFRGALCLAHHRGRGDAPSHSATVSVRPSLCCTAQLSPNLHCASLESMRCLQRRCYVRFAAVGLLKAFVSDIVPTERLTCQRFMQLVPTERLVLAPWATRCKLNRAYSPTAALSTLHQAACEQLFGVVERWESRCAQLEWSRGLQRLLLTVSDGGRSTCVSLTQVLRPPSLLPASWCLPAVAPSVSGGNKHAAVVTTAEVILCAGKLISLCVHVLKRANETSLPRPDRRLDGPDSGPGRSRLHVSRRC